MGGDLEHTKGLLRRRLLAVRRTLPRDAVARLSTAVCARAMTLAEFASARCVVGYGPMGGEVDPETLVAAATALGKMIYHPGPDPGHPDFLPVSAAAGNGRGGGPPVFPAAGEGVMVLVPGVAFDTRGARLGRGRGWYDRALRRYPRALRVGLAYELQMSGVVPEGPGDVRMHVLATEARLLRLDDRKEDVKR